MAKVTAACIIIGDEVLNGKVVDTNSTFFAKFCFDHGIQLKEIVTIGDDEAQIVDTVRRLVNCHDFIISTGGIGPTHDDITYECMARSFNLPCELDEECKERMRRKSDPEARLDADALKAHYQMATMPKGPNVRNYYVCDDLWVPICSISHKVYILPGIPQLFSKMLKGFTPTLKKIYNLEEDPREYVRYFVKTRLTESQISKELKLIQDESTEVSDAIKIGSYPHFGMGFNTVSILGEKKDDAYLKTVVSRVVKNLAGEEISPELEDKFSNQER
ncbi:hypothetical protein GRS66_009988 [Saccharomyces pastorianus]|uniref:MoaB/Mog domain-containing protein n=2 Tax=Saccharomyces TaxID=4930 RepID=A0A6C1EE01_SACPS|nr:hypothetical protein DI49_4261 [Saccharomyces eubayanus]KOG97507.1 hypothetical protein DI49_4261 [Saccharomyces eubayanus]QID87315.1 hypothetical protein GRS66_009988 [Saccharomyces pastorianus]CAI1644305.1 hypothetical protein SEUBUCD650_0M03090 [Saccharomyces eubayanus]